MTGKLKRTWIVAGGIAALVAAGAATAVAAGGDDDERPITGAALATASAAALDHTGGGRVTETEVGDEEGYYEVEVERPGGGQVDVHLDRDFNVIGAAGDDDGGGDED